MVTASAVHCGATPVKGMAFPTLDSLAFTEAGPAGDRLFALVDPLSRKVFRTVEHSALLTATATWDGTDLTITSQGATVTDAPALTGGLIDVNYWGRTEPAEVVTGAWEPLLEQVVGRPARLVRARRHGGVVYGGPVSIISAQALTALEELSGHSIDHRRFRATLVLDGAEPAVGQHVQVDNVLLQVTAPITRCRVIDLNPDTGAYDTHLLRFLGPEAAFGVEATVVNPGTVRRLRPWGTRPRT